MNWYRVRLNGQNFLLRLDKNSKKYGFYTVRDVKAKSFEDAENKAVHLVRNDQKLLNLTQNEKEDSPMINIDDIRIVESTEEKIKNTGFVYYLE